MDSRLQAGERWQHARVDERYALAYRESLRAIEAQETALENVRQRAGQLLAASTVAASVLGGVARARVNVSQDAATWVAVGTFVAVLVLCVWVLLPRKRWHLAISPTVLIDDWINEYEMDIDAIHCELAIRVERYWDRNQDTLDRRVAAIQLSATMLGISVVSWLIDLMR